MDSIEVLFKEYETLRSEILTGLSGRNTILSIGVTAVGVMYTVAAALFKSDAEITGLILVYGIPPMSLSILWIWYGEYRRVQEAGARLPPLESRINCEARQKLHVQEDLLTLETEVRNRRRQGPPYRFDPMVALLCLIALISVGIGLLVLPDAWNRYKLSLGLGLSLVIVVAYGYLIKCIRSLRRL